MAGMIIFLTNPIIPMRQRLIEKAKLLPEPESYFRGREIGGGFRLPSSLLLYWHDYPHERTIISTRHMLILPAVPMEYLVSGNRIALEPGRALLVKPYLRRSVPEGRERHDRLIVSFEAEEGQPYLPAEPADGGERCGIRGGGAPGRRLSRRRYAAVDVRAGTAAARTVGGQLPEEGRAALPAGQSRAEPDQPGADPGSSRSSFWRRGLGCRPAICGGSSGRSSASRSETTWPSGGSTPPGGCSRRRTNRSAGSPPRAVTIRFTPSAASSASGPASRRRSGERAAGAEWRSADAAVLGRRDSVCRRGASGCRG